MIPEVSSMDAGGTAPLRLLWPELLHRYSGAFQGRLAGQVVARGRIGGEQAAIERKTRRPEDRIYGIGSGIRRRSFENHEVCHLNRGHGGNERSDEIGAFGDVLR